MYLRPQTFAAGDNSGREVELIDDVFGQWNEDDANVLHPEQQGIERDYLRVIFNSVGQEKEARYFMSKFLPYAASIAKVTVGVRARAGGRTVANVDVRTHLHVAGQSFYGGYSTLSGGVDPYVSLETAYATNPATSQAWTPGQMPDGGVGGLQVGWSAKQPTNINWRARIGAVWARIDYAGVPLAQEQAREIVSRRLWHLRRAKGLLRLTVPLHVGLDVEVGDDLWVEHIAGMHAIDEGWREKLWQLRQFFIYGRRIDIARGAVELLLRDRRPVLCLYRDSLESPYSSHPSALGVSRFFADQPKSAYSRASDTWVMDPASRKFALRLVDEPLYTEGGQAFPYHETNLVLESAFKNYSDPDFTGWTRNGEDVNGSEISPDQGNVLFETGYLQSVFLLVGDPVPTADLEIITTSVFGAGTTANTRLTLGVWHEDHQGVPLYVAIQRDVDNWWMRLSDRTWISSKIWNAMPVIERIESQWDHFSDWFLSGGSTTGFKLAVGVPASAASAGQSHNLFCVKLSKTANSQLKGRSPFPIPIEAVLNAVGFPRLTLIGTENKRLYQEAQGAILIEFASYWDATELTAFGDLFFLASDDGLNVSPTKVLRLGIQNGSPPYLAWIAQENGSTTAGIGMSDSRSVIRTHLNKVLVRWTGVNGELDLPTYTMDIWHNGVKGTRVISGSQRIPSGMRDVLLPYLGIGYAPPPLTGLGQIAANLRDFRILQYAPQDAECEQLTVVGA